VLLRPLSTLTDEHGLITRRRAVDAGYDDRDLRRLVQRGHWVPLRRGVYAVREHWDDLDPYRGQPLLRIRAASGALRCEHVLSHDSSSIVQETGAPDPSRALVHVTRPKTHGDAVRSGVKHHLAPYLPGEVMVVDGLRVLDLARTAMDMAREHGLVAGVAVCDQALRRGVTRAQLRETRSRMWCWPGSRCMDAAIDLADRGAESWLESEARVFVAGLGIGRPETQLGLTDGLRTVWCDMHVRRHVFEVDGMVKYAGEDDWQSAGEVLRLEKERQDFVTGFKLGVTRLTAHDLRRGRAAAEARARREYDDTCARFGTDLSDLAPYRVTRRR